MGQMLTEAVWERKMQTFGSEQYDLRNENADGSETGAGLRVLQKYIRRAAVAIEEMQRKVITKPRTERTAKGTLIMVPAETLALLTLKKIIDALTTYDRTGGGVTYNRLSRYIGRAVETELNFRHWIASSKDAAKEYAEEHGIKEPRSLALRLIEEQGVTSRNLRQWSHTFKELTEYKWNQLSEYYCGDALLAAVVEALPECFEVYSPWHQGKPVKSVRMLPEFLQEFNDEEAKRSLLQAVRKPMLTKPKKWTINE